MDRGVLPPRIPILPPLLQGWRVCAVAVATATHSSLCFMLKRLVCMACVALSHRGEGHLPIQAPLMVLTRNSLQHVLLISAVISGPALRQQQPAKSAFSLLLLHFSLFCHEKKTAALTMTVTFVMLKSLL